MFSKSVSLFLVLSGSIALSGCLATTPQLGNGSSGGGTVSGSAAGSSTANKNSQLESCAEPLGTASVFEDQRASWWYSYRSRYQNLGSTIPVIRLMIQQSNCFVIVERGKAFKALDKERQLARSGESRQGSSFQKGQVVAADFTISPEIQFAQKGTGGIGGLLGGKLGTVGSIVAGGLKKNETSTTLLLVDNRSSVQLSASTGYAKNFDFGLGLGFFRNGTAAGGGAFSNTPEGKIISASFADAYNQMVRSLRTYSAQEVKGGLGKGGQLKVGK